MSRRARRWIFGLLAGAVLLVGGIGGFVVRPRMPAIAFLNRMAGDTPSPEALKGLGARDVATPRPRRLVLEAGPGAPVVVAVAGVTPEGIDDPRVRRLVAAFHDAGATVIAPQLDGLARPGEDAALLDDVVATWRDAAAGGRRVGMFGVSLGAGVVLRAVARGAPGDPAPATLAALLLVGAPDDAAALARDWFRRPVAPPGATGLPAARSDAGCFARHGLARAAAARRVPEADLAAVRAWLDAVGEAPAGGAAPSPATTSPEAARLVAAVRAEAGASDADVAWLLEGAAPFLDAASPAAAGSLARIAVPVVLVHGEEDPLVPVTEAGALARRLTSADVTVLRSRLLSHVEVASPGLRETWRHVTLVQGFLDAVGGR